MKEQMVPDVSLEASLRYSIQTEKPMGFCGYIVRWVPTAVSVLVAGLLVFNMAMPSKAEQLPVVGKAFESLNTTGKVCRESGMTPDFLTFEKEVSEPFSVSLSYAECDGLDLNFKIELEDNNNSVAPESDTVTISGVCVELSGMYIYPTGENPRLTRDEDGVFRGWAKFNSAPVASLLSEGADTEAVLHCRGLCAYVEGATYEEVISLYTYDFSASEDFFVDVDLSKLKIEYVGLSNEGITIEYFLRSEDRTDVVYSVDDTVEYASCFSIYTESLAPSLISMNTVKDGNGRYIYNATFADNISEDRYDNTFPGEMTEESILVYSHATGEYITFETEMEISE